MTKPENTSERVAPFAAVDSLTPRERECLLLVAEHLRSKEIARKLGLSPLTVDKYIASACERLEVNSRHEAAQLLAKSSGSTQPDPPDEDAVGGSLASHLLARTRRIGESLDRWETGRRSWVRTVGQLASLIAIFNIVRIASKRVLLLLNDLLPPELFSPDFLGRGAKLHSGSLGAQVIGTYWDSLTTFTLITLVLALWRGRLPVVATGATMLVGALICQVVEAVLSGPDAVRVVTLNDVIFMILMASFWTLYPRRWLSLCLLFVALMVAADFNVASLPSMNGQLWIISQGYLTLFITTVIALTAGTWPWAGPRLERLRAWLNGDLTPALQNR